jgi:hypothetical protein
MATDNTSITYTATDSELIFNGSDGLRYVKHTDGTYELFPDPVIPYVDISHETLAAAEMIRNKDIIDGVIEPPTREEALAAAPLPVFASLFDTHNHVECTTELLNEYTHYNTTLQEMIKACKAATDDGTRLNFKTPVTFAKGTAYEHTQDFVFHHSNKTAHLAHLTKVDADQKAFIKHIQDTLASQ